MAYPAKPESFALLALHKVARLYDLYDGNKQLISYRDVCNQFIHSSIFAPFTPFDTSLVGIYIASDKVRKKFLYYIVLVKIVEMFRAIGNNKLVRHTVQFNDKKEKYVVSS